MVSAGSITVAVRVRPPTAYESTRLPEAVYDTTIRGDGTLSAPIRPVASMSSVREIVQVVDDRILTFDPVETDQARAFVERGFVPPGSKRYKDKRFMFDRVFRYDASQQDVYDGTARPLLNNLLDGFNATVFAYGATGCGKTHTISGTPSDPGTIYLTMSDLFQRIEDRRTEYDVDVVVTFLEIYNEEIRDLLSEPGTPQPRGGLQIREDKSVKVVGLTELRPISADEVKEIVMLGNTRRTQSPTLANETSSRSHAVLQVHVTQAPRTASLTEQRTMGTLSIIDLAGSERAAATTNMGQRMVEGANINKSLLALGNCINSLCESGGAIRHVPYRNSKLTRLLKFSLGGNCKTVMIVCVAPTSLHFDDTHNTLIYAERATKIKTRVVTRNVLNVNRHVGQYVEAITKLNAEVAELKAKLAGKLGQEAEIARRKKQEAQSEVDRAKADLKTKATQMHAPILEGATCAGQLSAARLKLQAIRTRLDDLDRRATLSVDEQAERDLLRALAVPEENAVRPDSLLNNRIQRSNNSRSMFDAVLRAVSERRSDRLDEISVDNVRLDVEYRRMELEKFRAEAERDAIKDAMESQARMFVHLMGLVGRYTVVLGNAGSSIQAALSEGPDGLEGSVRAIAAKLQDLAGQNDRDFVSFVNHSVATYANMATGAASLQGFSGHHAPPPSAVSHAPRVSSAPGDVLAPPKARASRRSSSYGALGVGSPAKKTPTSVRSPRRSRTSVSGSAPYRRPSEKGKEKKGVQWRDEVGGEIDDGGAGPSRTPSISVTTAADEQENPFSQRMPPSVSESDWEDEKTDDSANYSLREVPFRPGGSSSLNSSSSRLSTGGRNGIRSDTLRARGISNLSSLAEDDENEGASPRRRRATPLSPAGYNANAQQSDSDSSGAASGSKLRMPKGSQERQNHSSPRRQAAQPTPRSVATSYKPGHSRRRSNVGVGAAGAKTRRRSSQIPQLSPHTQAESSSSAPLSRSTSHAPRRVALEQGPKSPAKRAKRMSLLALASRGMASARLKAANAPSAANTSVGDISMGDTSFRGLGGSARPKSTWK
ncbi:kinesin-domain-containing protein [Peniophora sp. CONT]|nr:kinesin-domain-containing protein [Peniophora sp. CONT]